MRDHSKPKSKEAESLSKVEKRGRKKEYAIWQQEEKDIKKREPS